MSITFSLYHILYTHKQSRKKDFLTYFKMYDLNYSDHNTYSYSL